MDNLKKLLTTPTALLPGFSRAYAGKLSKVLLLTSVGILTASPSCWAVVLAPTSLTVVVPTGSNNPQEDGLALTYTRTGSATSLTATNPNATNARQTYVDDILLNTVTFAGTTFQNSSNSFRNVQQLQVTSQRQNINAEFGDSDTISDLNPNPFVSAGVANEGDNLGGITNPTRESTVPNTQDRALTAAFNSLSISQGTDGEAAHAYRVLFDQGIVDNDIANSPTTSTVDNVPELVFFERGANSNFTARAIIGGTFNNPIYAPTTVTVAAANLTPSGVFIDTTEIDARQQLGVVGIDATEFGITDANTAIYGMDFTTDGTGADMYGQFTTAASSSQYRRQAVPEPLTIIGSAMALGFGVLMQRQYSKKLKKA